MDDFVDVVIEDDRWDAHNLGIIAQKCLKAVLDKLQVPIGPYEICLLACNDIRIAHLNKDFRGKDAPTNVLSWPNFEINTENAGKIPVEPQEMQLPDEPIGLGDIALAYETVLKETHEGSIELNDHITHLILHGILHLFGYDHETDIDAEIMETIEIEIMVSMGLGNPYKTV